MSDSSDGKKHELWKWVATISMGILVGGIVPYFALYKDTVSREEMREFVLHRTPYVQDRERVREYIARQQAFEAQYRDESKLLREQVIRLQSLVERLSQQMEDMNRLLRQKPGEGQINATGRFSEAESRRQGSP
jgi:hypothetical protein